jgi:hypothetical protein
VGNVDVREAVGERERTGDPDQDALISSKVEGGVALWKQAPPTPASFGWCKRPWVVSGLHDVHFFLVFSYSESVVVRAYFVSPSRL